MNCTPQSPFKKKLSPVPTKSTIPLHKLHVISFVSPHPICTRIQVCIMLTSTSTLRTFISLPNSSKPAHARIPTREEGDNYCYQVSWSFLPGWKAEYSFVKNHFLGPSNSKILENASSKAPAAVTPRGEERVMFHTFSAPPRCNRKKKTKGKAVHLHMILPTI